jgi:hypothetical protein
MGPIDGHFFCDLVSRQLLLETAPRVIGWIERCRYPNTDQQEEWLAGDALAPSLVRVLDVMSDDAVPVLLDVLRAFESWADTRPADLEEPPRAVGRCKTSLRGVPIERAILAYTLYSAQTLLDFYRGLEPKDRSRVDTALAETAWPELLAYAPRHRLRKDGFKLVFERT